MKEKNFFTLASNNNKIFIQIFHFLRFEFQAKSLNLK